MAPTEQSNARTTASFLPRLVKFSSHREAVKEACITFMQSVAIIAASRQPRRHSCNNGYQIGREDFDERGRITLSSTGVGYRRYCSRLTRRGVIKDAKQVIEAVMPHQADTPSVPSNKIEYEPSHMHNCSLSDISQFRMSGVSPTAVAGGVLSIESPSPPSTMHVYDIEPWLPGWSRHKHDVSKPSMTIRTQHSPRLSSFLHLPDSDSTSSKFSTFSIDFHQPTSAHIINSIQESSTLLIALSSIKSGIASSHTPRTTSRTAL